MADDVFASGSTPPAAAAPENPLAELVGEGKKFKTVEDLAKGKAEADRHIANLEAEMAKLREQLTPQFNAEEQLASLRQELEALKTGGAPKPASGVTPPALTAEAITRLVNETITRTEQNRTAQQNIDDANGAVVTHFGSLEAATTAVRARAAELKMTASDLKAIAEKSPTAFKQIMQLEAPKGADEAPLAPRGQAPVNNGGQPPLGTPQPGTKEHFDAILKRSRREYFDPKTQMALHAAVKAGTYKL